MMIYREKEEANWGQEGGNRCWWRKGGDPDGSGCSVHNLRWNITSSEESSITTHVSGQDTEAPWGHADLCVKISHSGSSCPFRQGTR